MKVRHTGAQISEPKSEKVCLTMKSDYEDNLLESASGLEDTKKVGANKVVRTNRSKPNLGGTDEFCYNTILDSSTEWTILGSPAYSITKQFNRSLNMSVVDDTMSGVAMQLCDAVTAILNGNGQVHLLGVRRVIYSPTLTDDEALINTRFIREAG
eukprot:9830956-Ditylum_brightwellii.AAC.1